MAPACFERGRAPSRGVPACAAAARVRLGGERASRTAPRVATGLAIAFLAFPCGCHHLIAPIQPDALPREESESPLPSGLRIRVVSGFEAPVVRSLGTEGIHHLQVDLRDWTARLVAEVAGELRARGILVEVPSRSLAGTSVADEEDGGASALWRLPTPRLPESAEALPTLRVWVLEVRRPSPGQGGVSAIEATLESADGTFSGHYAAAPESRGFRAAFLDLKRRIIGDPRLRTWLERRTGESESGPSTSARAGSE